jgi:DNA ligase-1
MTEETTFSELARLCEELASTRKRTEKASLIAAFLKSLKEEEVAPATFLIVGSIFSEVDPRTLEISYATVSRIIDRVGQTTLFPKPLTILGVYESFSEIAAASGKGSRRRKESLLEGMFSQATDIEAKWLVKNLFGEMQHGVSEGVMMEGIAKAAGVEVASVRRANMARGNLGEVARIALTSGIAGLEQVTIQLFRPVKPMLAEMAEDIPQVLSEHGGRTALEYKFDGARVQIHKRGGEVRIFSRRLTDVTGSLPEVVELARSRIRADDVLVEGEVVAVGEGEKPLPFQDLMRRFRRVHEVDTAMREIPVRLYLFDILYLGGKPLVDVPNDERWRFLASLCDGDLLAERMVTDDASAAGAFLKRSIDAGHEGLMAKALDSDYTPGVRGKKWFKIKPADRLDLVIVGADWGYGRRTGWLSDYYLAARDEKTGRFEVVGKTFKGLTDEEFVRITERLRGIKIRETEHTVYVRPEIVVEIAYSEIQKSPTYRSGFALRFARIARFRDDKRPEDADTLQRMQVLYEKQFEHKARFLGF